MSHDYRRRLAGRLFPEPIRLSLTVEEHNDIVAFALSLYSNGKTNVTYKSPEIAFETARIGAIAEMGVKTALGLDRKVHPSIKLNDETTYARDFLWEDKWVEVKSISPGFEGRGMISYNARAAQTMMKHADKLEAVVFANVKMIDDLNWVVDAAWVINPQYFNFPYLTFNDERNYLKFEPIRHERLRSPNVCYWNPRVVTAMDDFQCLLT